MKKRKVGRNNSQSKILRVFMLLSIAGIIISLYLVKNHYEPVTAGSFCDVSEVVSCSLVNTSVYSELFNVPIALFGALWFVGLFLFSWKWKPVYNTIIFAWSIIGILSVVYLVIAEIILQAICPLCTVIHVFIIIILALAIKMYRQQHTPLMKSVSATLPLLIAMGVLFVLPLVIFNWPSGPKENYDQLAQCINSKGIVMYGSFKCAVCAKTRAMFGDSFQYVKEIECHPQGVNPETDRCLKKEIKGTPTWVLEPDGPDGVEVKRQQGFMSIDDLRAFSGCN